MRCLSDGTAMATRCRVAFAMPWVTSSFPGIDFVQQNLADDTDDHDVLLHHIILQHIYAPLSDMSGRCGRTGSFPSLRHADV